MAKRSESTADALVPSAAGASLTANSGTADPGAGWTGEEHRLKIEAAKEAGIRPSDAELESFTEGLSESIVVDDPSDHAIVATGRTVLAEAQ